MTVTIQALSGIVHGSQRPSTICPDRARGARS